MILRKLIELVYWDDQRRDGINGHHCRGCYDDDNSYRGCSFYGIYLSNLFFGNLVRVVYSQFTIIE